MANSGFEIKEFVMRSGLTPLSKQLTRSPLKSVRQTHYG
jgi:hypothetical protein